MDGTADLYRVLQVDPKADSDVIRAAYRVLAARNHPDLGGSSDRMAELNNAWAVVSNPATRAAYDTLRRLRDGGGRWDAYMNGGPAASVASDGRVLEFGRFAGWSISQVARSDPDYLEWFERTPNGRRYATEIEHALRRSTGPSPTLATQSPATQARPRSRLRWR